MKFKGTYLAILLLTAGLVQARTLSLDLRGGDASPSSRTGAARRLASKSSGGGERRTELAAGAAEVGDVEVGDVLDVAFFTDASASIRLMERMPCPFGGEAFLAETTESGGARNAVVLRTADGLVIDVQDFASDKVYKVISSPSSVVVQESEPSDVGGCGNDSLEPRSEGETTAPDAGRAAGMRALSSVSPPVSPLGAAPDDCIDILVAYDKNAAAWARDSGGGTTNFAQVAVQKMNAVLANTGLSSSFRFRLVGVVALSVSAEDVHTALHAIADGKSGWSAVKTARDAFGADIVTTLVDTGSENGSTGVGWSLSRGADPSAFGGNAYNVCAIRSVAKSNTMAHECGHNLGAGHSDRQVTEPGPQFQSHSAGYYFVDSYGEKCCTVMAYGDEGPGGKAVPYFSSPDFDYNGVPVGDAAHDNTKTLADTWRHAANWRARKVPMSYDVSFSPAPGTIFDGTVSVTLTPGKPGTTIRYTTDGKTPTSSSPVYSKPLALAKTTTVKAVTVVDGVCSLPYEATFFSQGDIGTAIGIPGLSWKTSVPANSSCGVFTEDSIDGAGVLAEVAQGKVCKISTTVTGPASLVCKGLFDGGKSIQVFCDGKKSFGDVWNGGWGYSMAWEEIGVDVPSGSHAVEFRLGSTHGTTKYWLDDFGLFFTRKPVFSPVTTTDSNTAFSFSREQVVTLKSPDAGASILYTLDGSDPNGDGAILYDGPFFISESTKVKAIAFRPGKGPSAVAEGWYCERHVPTAGEWSLSGSGAYAAAKKNGRMTATLCWNYPGCGWSAALASVITDPAFETWAEINGIYLVADSWGDAPPATGVKFWSLYDATALSKSLGGYVYYPTFVFTSASDPSKSLGAMLARDDGEHKTNGRWYRNSVESLASCFASFLVKAPPLGPPVASATSAVGKTFPFSVALSNTNGTGTIYYTLDGSAPTRGKGTKYSGPITIPKSGTTLKAAVWPAGANEVSGVPLVATYESLGDIVGVDGVAWSTSASLPWTASRNREGGIELRGGKDPSKDMVVSTLKAKVNGPGRFLFGMDMFSNWGSRLELIIDGETVGTWDWLKGFTTNVVITTSGTTTFEWVYRGSSSDSRGLSPDEYSYVSAVLKDIEWRPDAPPKAVKSLRASQGAYSFGTVLRWTASSNSASFDIYRSTTSDASTAKQIGTTKQNRYWDMTGEIGKPYFYWVVPVNEHGEGSRSSAVSGYRRNDTYAVKYNANGGKLPKGKKMAKQTLTYGKAAKLRKNVFTRKGYVFAGWAVSKANAKKGVIAFANAQKVKNLRSDGKTTTLYAVWAKPTFKVAFYANGGKGKMAAEKMTYGKAKKLPANKFTRKGYVFKGWAKSKALAKKGKVAYKNKKSVKNLTTTGKTVKLYAVWKKK